MSKIQRKFLAHYIDAAKPGENAAKYVRLGKDLEEFSAELSATVEKTPNILGETNVVLSGYEKQGTVEPYYAEQGDALSERLREIADEMLVLDECASTLVDVHLWEPAETEGYPAIRWDVILEVSSVGGDVNGVSIPFNIHYTGEKVKGFFDVATKKFTPAV